MPTTDPRIQEEPESGETGPEAGGMPDEYVDSDHNEPGSQAPPSGPAVGDVEDR